MSTTYAGADAFAASVTIPSDGDAASAASVNTPLQGLADRTTYLKNRLGAVFLVERAQYGVADAADAFATITSWAGAAWPGTQYNCLTLSGSLAGDQVLFTVSGMLASSVLATQGLIRAEIKEGAGSYVAVDGAKTISEYSGHTGPFAITGYYLVSTGGTLTLALDGKALGAGTLLLVGALSVEARLYRPV